MKSVENLKLSPKSTIREALHIIDTGAMQIAIVVDEHDRLIGTLTDGDIRRGLLNNLSLDASIESIVFKTPTVATLSDTKEEILKKALNKKLHQIPIVDEENRVIGIKEIEELVKSQPKPNKVILMVGGLRNETLPSDRNYPETDAQSRKQTDSSNHRRKICRIRIYQYRNVCKL